MPGMTSALRPWMIALGIAAAPVMSTPVAAQPRDHRLPSRPETVVWGEIPVERAPVLTIASGDTVAVDTLSHSGATQDEDPVAFLGARGVARNEVLQDAIEQDDGEVNGTAIEHSLSGRFRFVLHKGKALAGPRAETATHYVMMGIDLDLDRALRLATAEVIDFLTREKGLSAADAYTLASIACDFHIAEAVDLTQVVVGKTPKDVFRRR